jgi:CBS domain-containing protein
MDTSIPKLFIDNTLADLETALTHSHHHGFVLTSREHPEQLRGIVTLSDMERARQNNLPPYTPLSSIGQMTVHTALPNETISNALERMAQLHIGRMPVVNPNNNHLVGFVRQSDLAKAYYQAIERQRHLEESQEATRLRDLTGQEIIEVKIRQTSSLAGKTLREAKLPKESIVVAIRRNGKTIFPHGDTRLEPGDTVVANVAPGFGQTFKVLFDATT